MYNGQEEVGMTNIVVCQCKLPMTWALKLEIKYMDLEHCQNTCKGIYLPQVRP